MFIHSTDACIGTQRFLQGTPLGRHGAHLISTRVTQVQSMEAASVQSFIPHFLVQSWTQNNL